jgi:hypothetical protein
VLVVKALLLVTAGGRVVVAPWLTDALRVVVAARLVVVAARLVVCGRCPSSCGRCPSSCGDRCQTAGLTRRSAGGGGGRRQR